MGDDTIYQSSRGGFFGDADVWEQFESGAWTPCCWDDETGEEWVETRRGDVLLLMPVRERELPEWVHVEHHDDGLRVTTEASSPLDMVTTAPTG